MKITLHKLELKNFRSVSSATIEFDANGMVLLQGPSGAGKSTVNLAIAYIFGFCPYPQNQLQKWGTDEMSVSLEFFLDDKKIWVHRGTDFVGCAGPEEMSAINGAKNVNSRLQTLLKITPDMLGALTYRPQQEPGAFVRKTDAEKKEFLVQILRLDQFEQALEVSSQEIKKLEIAVELASNDVTHLERALADAKAEVIETPAAEEVAQAEKTIEQTRARLLDNTPRLKVLEGLNPEAAEKQKLQEQANKHLDQAIAQDESRATEFQLQRRKDRDSLTVLRTKQTQADTVSTKITTLNLQRDSLLETGRCPTCGQATIDGEALVKIDNNINLLRSKHKPLTEAELMEMHRLDEAGIAQFVPSPAIDKLRKIASRFYSEVQVAQEQNKAAIQQLKRENIEGQRTIEQLTRYLSAAKQAIAAHARSQKNVETKQKELEGSLERRQGILVSLAAERDFVALVGNQGFLGAIFEEVLQDISLDTNEILGKVQNTSSVTIEFRTESVTQKGVLKKSITPIVSVGGNVGAFDAILSGGMKTVAMLAIDLAVAKVIARRSGIQPGWLILDEPGDGMDSKSRLTMYELLSNEAQSKLVIVADHSLEASGLFNKSIKASCDNGTTTYGY